MESVSEEVEVLHFQYRGTVSGVQAGPDGVTCRIDSVAVLYFIDRQIDPAFGKEVVREEKTKDHGLPLAGRSQMEIIHVDPEIQIIKRIQRKVGAVVICDLLHVPFGIPFNVHAEGAPDLKNFERLPRNLRINPSIDRQILPAEIV